MIFELCSVYVPGDFLPFDLCREISKPVKIPFQQRTRTRFETTPYLRFVSAVSTWPLALPIPQPKTALTSVACSNILRRELFARPSIPYIITSQIQNKQRCLACGYQRTRVSRVHSTSCDVHCRDSACIAIFEHMLIYIIYCRDRCDLLLSWYEIDFPEARIT